MYICGMIPTFHRQQGPLRSWYPSTTLHCVTTQNTSTWWRWRQRGPLERWYPTKHYVASQSRRLQLGEDGVSMDLLNFGILPQHYMASRHRRPWLEMEDY